MASRAKTSSKTKTARQQAVPESAVEQVAAATPRRERKPKLRDVQPADMSLADAFYLGGEGSTPDAPVLEGEVSAKPRRGRNPKVQPTPTPAIAGGDNLHGTERSVELADDSVESEPSDAAASIVADSTPDMPPIKARRGRPPKIRPVERPSATPANQPAQAAAVGAQPTGRHEVKTPTSAPSAAQWDPDTGIVTFDWPTIEQVAKAEGPNQAMAKLLLAARAEGANSRWPF